MSFSWTQMIPGVGTEYSHVATAGIVTGGLVVAGLAARVKLGKGEKAVVPAGEFGLRGIFEFTTEFVANLAEMVIGHEGKKFIPMFAAVFFYVLINNLVGLIPGVTPATENINTTFPMGIFMFLAYNIMGVKEHGLPYLKHFLGPLLLLAPIMLPIEIISHCLRPLTLGLRLANVMTGDHTVLGIFLGIVPIGVPIPFYLLGLFVCFVQAFVFTLLSMVYVAMAISHDH